VCKLQRKPHCQIPILPRQTEAHWQKNSQRTRSCLTNGINSSTTPYEPEKPTSKHKSWWINWSTQKHRHNNPIETYKITPIQDKELSIN
jgi:hypothetical protein